MSTATLPFFEAPPAPPQPPTLPEGEADATHVEAQGFFRIGPSRLAGLSAPFWILQAYLFVAHTFIDEEWAAVRALRPRLVLGTLALGFAGWQLFSGDRRGSTGPEEHRAVARWLVAFMIAGLAAMVWAFDPTAAREAQVEHTTTMLVFFLVVAIVRTRQEVLVTTLVLSLAFGGYLLRSFTEFLHGKHQFTMGVSRMMGAGTSYADPNSFAATVAFTMPLLSWVAVHARSRFLKFCVLCYGLIGAASVVSTHSRSGLILLVLNVLFAFLLLPGGKSRVALAAVIVGLGVHLASGQTDNAMERYESILSSKTYTKESSTLGRIEGYRVAWQMFNENPVFGVGPGCWSAYRMRRVDGVALYPHNMPGQLIATTGIAGALTFAGYLASVLLFAFGARRRRAGSVDPWDRAVGSLAGVTAFTIVLLLVSGTAAHNVERPAWYLLPAILAVAARATRAQAPGVPGRPVEA